MTIETTSTMIFGMKATSFALPKYTLAQELWNAISHGLGAVLTLVGGFFLIWKAVDTGDVFAIISSAIWTFGNFIMFAMSCIYHALAPCKGKQVLRVMDHDFIFAAIMATYVPYCLVNLQHIPGTSFPWGWIILGIVWAGCITGIVFNSINLKKFEVLSIVLYVVLGSTIVGAFYPLYLSLNIWGVLLLLLGGIFYWIGAMLYGLGAKKSVWFHTVFHFAVLFGAISMYFSIYFYVLA